MADATLSINEIEVVLTYLPEDTNDKNVIALRTKLTEAYWTPPDCDVCGGTCTCGKYL